MLTPLRCMSPNTSNSCGVFHLFLLQGVVVKGDPSFGTQKLREPPGETAHFAVNNSASRQSPSVNAATSL